MKRKNYFRVICLSVCMMLIATYFTGCANKTSSAINGEVTTIRVWTGARHISSIMKEMVAQYNDTLGKKDGIKIEYTDYGDDFKNVYEMAFASDQAPELCGITGGAKDPIEKNWILPIEDLPGGNEFLANIKEPLINGVHKFGGKTYCLPFSYTNLKLVYNKDLFKKSNIVDEKGEAKPPKTWQEVAEYAKIITKNGGGKEYGLIFPMKNKSFFWEWEFIRPFQKASGSMVDPLTGKYQFKNFKTALTEFILKVKQDRSFLPGPEGIDNDVARAQFSEGIIGMKVAASWDVSVFNHQFPAKCDWGIVDLPVFEGQQKYKENVLNGNSLVYITNSVLQLKNQDKVMKVYEWFNGNEFKTKMYEEGKYIISDPEIAKNAKKVPTEKGWKEFSTFDAKNMQTVRYPMNKVAQGSAYWDVFEKIWMGSATDIDKELSELETNYNKSVQELVSSGRANLDDYIIPNAVITEE